MVKNRINNKSFCKENIHFLKYLQTLPLKKRNKLILNNCSKNELKH